MIEPIRSLSLVPHRIGRTPDRIADIPYEATGLAPHPELRNPTPAQGGFESVEVLTSKRYRSKMIRLVRSLSNRVLLMPEIAIPVRFVNSN